MTVQQEFKIFLQTWKFFLQDFIQYNAEVNHYYSSTGHERLMKRDSFSGYLSLGMNRKVFGPCGGSNLQVTSNAMLVQSLGPVSSQTSVQNCPPYSLAVPFTDAR